MWESVSAGLKDCSGASIVDFEQINAGWKAKAILTWLVYLYKLSSKNVELNNWPYRTIVSLHLMELRRNSPLNDFDFESIRDLLFGELPFMSTKINGKFGILFFCRSNIKFEKLSNTTS